MLPEAIAENQSHAAAFVGESCMRFDFKRQFTTEGCDRGLAALPVGRLLFMRGNYQAKIGPNSFVAWPREWTKVPRLYGLVHRNQLNL